MVIRMVTKTYNTLMEKTKQITILDSIASIMAWDMETKMPPKGIKLRSQQMALLSQIEHKMSTDPKIRSLLEKIMKHKEYDNLDLIKKRNIYLIKKNYDEQTKLPEKLVVETAKQQALTVDIWK